MFVLSRAGEAAGQAGSSPARVPLRGVAIEVRATNTAATVVVTQRYQNAESGPVEAVYTFPLEERSAVCGFEVETAGRLIRGRVEEREKAFETYDQALAQGHGAYLLDQDRPNIFTASVGNLLPGQQATVRITYVTELEQTGEHLRLMIPSTISPRYIPPDQVLAMDPSELDHLTPPTVLGAVPYGLKLAVDIAAASAIAAVECPSHPVKIAVTGANAHIELMGTDVQMDQDVVLTIRLADPHRASAVVANEADGAKVAMVNLYPDLAQDCSGPGEIIFLLDRSGSMQGSSIEQARNALLLCLRSLSEGDWFNIVGFGSSFQSLFPASVPYVQANLDQATRHVQNLQADLGGTEIMKPLQAILEQPARPGLPRQLLLLTDGQVGNEGECIDLVAKHAASVRLFSFGIGYGASEFLVRGVARASNGAAEFIHPNERIEPIVLRQLGRVKAPWLTDVKLDWGGMHTGLIAPAKLPQLFHGDRITVYAQITGGSATEVAVVARTPAGERRFSAPLAWEQAVDNPAIPVLMARTAIRDLEEGQSGDGAAGSAQQSRRQARTKARIIELACRYGLMSSETSFVAVEERSAGQGQGPPTLRRVPIAVTKDWHGTASAAAQPPVMVSPGFGMPLAAPPPAPSGVDLLSRTRTLLAEGATMASLSLTSRQSPEPQTKERTGGLTLKLTSLFRKSQAKQEIDSSERDDDSGKQLVEAPAALEPSPSADRLLDLIMNQQADGSWLLTQELADIAGSDIARLHRAAQLFASADAARIVATALAVHVLRDHYPEREDEWRLIAAKAERWLRASGAQPPAGAASFAEWIATVINPS